MDRGLADPREEGRRRFVHAAEAYAAMLRAHPQNAAQTDARPTSARD
jgi:hypothetical protein